MMITLSFLFIKLKLVFLMVSRLGISLLAH